MDDEVCRNCGETLAVDEFMAGAFLCEKVSCLHAYEDESNE